MSSEELKKEYIRNKLQGICQDCIYFNDIIPLISDMLSEQYIKGLEQSRFDKNMLELENKQLKEKLDKINKIIKEEE